MKKKVINILISVVITLFFVRAVFSVLTSGDVIGGILAADPLLFAVAAGCYVMTYPLRAFRIFYLSRRHGDVTFGKILPVCFRHQFFGRIIPFKAGELSLVYLLRKRCGISPAKGGTTLVFLRAADAVVMVVSYLICNLFVGVGGGVSYIAAALLVLLAVFAALFFVMFPKIAAFAKRKNNRIAAMADGVFEMLRAIRPKDFAVIFASTVLLWVFVYLSMHFVAAAFFDGLSVFQTVVASFLASAAAFLPVNGLGGFGTTEAGWTLGFVLIGMDRSTALVSGIASNLMSFVIVCVFGLLSFLKRGDRVVRDNNNQ